MNFLATNDLIRYIPSEWIVCFVFLLGIAIYMLPTWIAGFTKHPDTVGIAVVNAVFGWSGIGFLLCLIWAFRKPEHPRQQVVQHFAQVPVPPPVHQTVSVTSAQKLEEQLFVLESLKERKLITDTEYQSRRKKLIDTL